MMGMLIPPRLGLAFVILEVGLVLEHQTLVNLSQRSCR